MRVLDPGHRYALRHLDGPSEEYLRFVKREGEGYPGNEGHSAGTTMQEVLRALIDRARYVNRQIPDAHTQEGIRHMQIAIYEFERRAAERHGRINTFHATWWEIEKAATCDKCGHVLCGGECHQ